MRCPVQLVLVVVMAVASLADGAYVPTKASAQWPVYETPSEWPEKAGRLLPKWYSEPITATPFADLPKNVSHLHCDFLVASQIRWIVFLGDSVARAAGLAAMEHLAGDDVHFCDPVDAPEQVSQASLRARLSVACVPSWCLCQYCKPVFDVHAHTNRRAGARPEEISE